MASVHHNNFDPANPMSCIENNPSVPRNCTITRPPPITRYEEEKIKRKNKAIKIVQR